MRRNLNLRTYLLLGISALLLSALAGDFMPSRMPVANIPVPHGDMWRGGVVPRAQAEGLAVYLPVVFRNHPAPSVFGVQMDSITDNGGLGPVTLTSTRWVHGPGILWSAVESSPGVRNWTVLASLEQELQNAANNGLVPIIGVRSTPTWARKVPSFSCSAIKEEYLPTFASFVHDLVARYSAPPYNIKYWEIWNEPDVDPRLFVSDNWYGCWGNQDDPYYGGGYYATVLQAVYPQIKAADPQAQVLIGGLLLDCNPGICSVPSGQSPPAKYLEGILRGGGAPFFDGVSFHAYDYYTGSGHYSNNNWGSAWNTTGPVLVAKSNFVSQTLQTLMVSGKYLINSEAGLVCPTTTCDTAFENTKAYYLVQDYATAIGLGMRSNIWYSLYGERGTGLIDLMGNLLPAYYAYQFATRELTGATSTRPITEYPNVKGYEFNRGDRIIWVVWSTDGMAHSVTPSRGIPLAAWDALGNTVTPASPMSVGTPPLYLEWTP